MIISLFETVRLSVLISPRNLYNSFKSIKKTFCQPCMPFFLYLPENKTTARRPRMHFITIENISLLKNVTYLPVLTISCNQEGYAQIKA